MSAAKTTTASPPFPIQEQIFHVPGCTYAYARQIVQVGANAERVSLQLILSDGSTATLDLLPRSPGIIRLSMTPGENTSCPGTEALLELPQPVGKTRFTGFEETPHSFEIQFEEYHLELRKSPFDLIIHRRGHPTVFQLAHEILDHIPVCPGLGWRSGGNRHGGAFLSWHLPSTIETFGLGEKWQSVEKSRSQTTIFASDTRGCASTDLAYKGLPLVYTTAGWGLIAASTTPSHWEIGHYSRNCGSLLVEENAPAFYLVLGDDLKDVFQKGSEILGKPSLPPHWALGTWVSRCMYANSSEATKAIEGFRENGLPADVISLDPAWMRHLYQPTIGIDACDFARHDLAFPGLPQIMKNWLAEGFATCLWVNPYIPEKSNLFQEAKRLNFLVLNDKGAHARVDGRFPAGLLDFTNPEATQWWKKHLQELLADGAAVFKADYGEGVPHDARFHNGHCGQHMHNLYPHLFAKACFEARQEMTGSGFVWRRSGYLGSSRFPGTWGGDTPATWEGFAACLRGALSASISGEAFWACDIGGFDGPSPDAELYIRWAQFGAFCGLTRFHGTTPREPWHFGTRALEIVRKHLEARYRLMPYLLACANEAANSGLPLMRPMRLEFPAEPGVQHCEDQFMLGPDLLIAPILHPGAVSRTIHFPEGRWWRLDHNAPTINGGGFRTVQAPIETIPVFVREGAVIPRYEKAPPHLKGPSPRALTIDIYPGESEHSLDIPEKDFTVQLLYRRQAHIGQFLLRPIDLEVTLRLIDTEASPDDATPWIPREDAAELTTNASEGIAFELNQPGFDEPSSENESLLS